MTRIEGRKADHINICLNERTEPGHSYWDDVKLVHEALPEVDWDSIDTSCTVLGKELSFPFMVTAITGEEDPTVVVTLEDNGRNLYASDQRESSEQEDGRTSLEQENTHVLLEDSQGSQYALTVTKTQPKVKGVVVVSRMAGDPAVQEKLLTAVCTALDVSTAKVCVVGSA